MERTPSSHADPSRRVGVLVALLALTSLALALRLQATGFGLPHKPTTDEEVYAGQFERLKGKVPSSEVDPRLGVYPQFVSRIALLLTRNESPAGLARMDPARSRAEHLERASADLRFLRQVVAWLSILIVPGTWFLARRFVEPAAALLAAGFMAFSLLHLVLSAQARPHCAAAGFGVLSIACALEVRRTGRLRAYLLAGLCSGLAVGVLASGLATLIPLFSAHLLRPKPRRARQHLELLAALLVFVACVLPFYPLLFGGGAKADAPQNYMPFAKIWQNLSIEGFRTLWMGVWHFDPLILSFVLLGFGMWLARNRSGSGSGLSPDLLVVLTYVVAYLLVFGTSRLTAYRYAIPLLPMAACLAAWGVYRVGDFMSGRVRHAPAIVLLLLQATAAWHLSKMSGGEDTTEQAADWIEEHLSPDKDRIAAVPSASLPLLYEPTSLPPPGPTHPLHLWIPYQTNLGDVPRHAPTWQIVRMNLLAPEQRAEILADVRGYLRGLDARYVVIERFDRPVLNELIDGIRTHGHLVARFGPTGGGDGDARPFLWFGAPEERVGVFCWAWRMMQVDSLGPVVEIHELDRL